MSFMTPAERKMLDELKQKEAAETQYKLDRLKQEAAAKERRAKVERIKDSQGWTVAARFHPLDSQLDIAESLYDAYIQGRADGQADCQSWSRSR